MTANIDSESGLLYQVKRPTETRKFSVDFKKLLETGVTIASVQSVSAVAAEKVTEIAALTTTNPASSGTKATFDVSGGTDGENYEITINATDSSGDVLSEDVLIMVRKAGSK
jgi:glucan biosynthesis protein